MSKAEKLERAIYYMTIDAQSLRQYDDMEEIVSRLDSLAQKMSKKLEELTTTQLEKSEI
jgi:hypothetical protein